MSFVCKACGRQRSGSGEVCSGCWDTQMGAAAKLLVYFENRRFSDEHIAAIDEILAAAGNPLFDSEADGSITEPRWNRLIRLTRAARAFNEAIDEAIPRSHREDW